MPPRPAVSRLRSSALWPILALASACSIFDEESDIDNSQGLPEPEPSGEPRSSPTPSTPPPAPSPSPAPSETTSDGATARELTPSSGAQLVTRIQATHAASGKNVYFTLVFSESLSGIETQDFIAENGRILGVSSDRVAADGSVTVTVAPDAGLNDVLLYLNFSDEASFLGTTHLFTPSPLPESDASILVDTQGPQVEGFSFSVSEPATGAPERGLNVENPSLTLTLTFDDAVFAPSFALEEFVLDSEHVQLEVQRGRDDAPKELEIVLTAQPGQELETFSLAFSDSIVFLDDDGNPSEEGFGGFTFGAFTLDTRAPFETGRSLSDISISTLDAQTLAVVRLEDYLSDSSGSYRFQVSSELVGPDVGRTLFFFQDGVPVSVEIGSDLLVDYVLQEGSRRVTNNPNAFVGPEGTLVLQAADLEVFLGLNIHQQVNITITDSLSNARTLSFSIEAPEAYQVTARERTLNDETYIEYTIFVTDISYDWDTEDFVVSTENGTVTAISKSSVTRASGEALTLTVRPDTDDEGRVSLNGELVQIAYASSLSLSGEFTLEFTPKLLGYNGVWVDKVAPDFDHLFIGKTAGAMPTGPELLFLSEAQPEATFVLDFGDYIDLQTLTREDFVLRDVRDNVVPLTASSFLSLHLSQDGPDKRVVTVTLEATGSGLDLSYYDLFFSDSVFFTDLVGNHPVGTTLIEGSSDYVAAPYAGVRLASYYVDTSPPVISRVLPDVRTSHGVVNDWAFLPIDLAVHFSDDSSLTYQATASGELIELDLLGSTLVAALLSLDPGEVTVTVTATDWVGNATEQSFTLTRLPPLVRAVSASETHDDVLEFTLTLAQAVSGIEPGDFFLRNGAVQGVSARRGEEGEQVTVTVRVDPLVNDETISLEGRPGEGFQTSDGEQELALPPNGLYYDNTPPVVLDTGMDTVHTILTRANPSDELILYFDDRVSADPAWTLDAEDFIFGQTTPAGWRTVDWVSIEALTHDATRSVYTLTLSVTQGPVPGLGIDSIEQDLNDVTLAFDPEAMFSDDNGNAYELTRYADQIGTNANPLEADVLLRFTLDTYAPRFHDEADRSVIEKWGSFEEGDLIGEYDLSGLYEDASGPVVVTWSQTHVFTLDATTGERVYHTEDIFDVTQDGTTLTLTATGQTGSETLERLVLTATDALGNRRIESFRFKNIGPPIIDLMHPDKFFILGAATAVTFTLKLADDELEGLHPGLFRVPNAELTAFTVTDGVSETLWTTPESLAPPAEGAPAMAPTTVEAVAPGVSPDGFLTVYLVATPSTGLSYTLITVELTEGAQLTLTDDVIRLTDLPDHGLYVDTASARISGESVVRIDTDSEVLVDTGDDARTAEFRLVFSEPILGSTGAGIDATTLDIFDETDLAIYDVQSGMYLYDWDITASLSDANTETITVEVTAPEDIDLSTYYLVLHPKLYEPRIGSDGMPNPTGFKDASGNFFLPRPATSPESKLANLKLAEFQVDTSEPTLKPLITPKENHVLLPSYDATMATSIATIDVVSDTGTVLTFTVNGLPSFHSRTTIPDGAELFSFDLENYFTDDSLELNPSAMIAYVLDQSETGGGPNDIFNITRNGTMVTLTSTGHTAMTATMGMPETTGIETLTIRVTDPHGNTGDFETTFGNAANAHPVFSSYKIGESFLASLGSGAGYWLVEHLDPLHVPGSTTPLLEINPPAGARRLWPAFVQGPQTPDEIEDQSPFTFTHGTLYINHANPLGPGRILSYNLGKLFEDRDGDELSVSVYQDPEGQGATDLFDFQIAAYPYPGEPRFAIQHAPVRSEGDSSMFPSGRETVTLVVADSKGSSVHLPIVYATDRVSLSDTETSATTTIGLDLNEPFRFDSKSYFTANHDQYFGVKVSYKTALEGESFLPLNHFFERGGTRYFEVPLFFTPDPITLSLVPTDGLRNVPASQIRIGDVNRESIGFADKTLVFTLTDEAVEAFTPLLTFASGSFSASRSEIGFVESVRGGMPGPTPVEPLEHFESLSRETGELTVLDLDLLFTSKDLTQALEFELTEQFAAGDADDIFSVVDATPDDGMLDARVTLNASGTMAGVEQLTITVTDFADDTNTYTLFVANGDRFSPDDLPDQPPQVPALTREDFTYEATTRVTYPSLPVSALPVTLPLLPEDGGLARLDPGDIFARLSREQAFTVKEIEVLLGAKNKHWNKGSASDVYHFTGTITLTQVPNLSQREFQIDDLTEELHTTIHAPPGQETFRDNMIFAAGPLFEDRRNFLLGYDRGLYLFTGARADSHYGLDYDITDPSANPWSTSVHFLRAKPGPHGHAAATGPFADGNNPVLIYGDVGDEFRGTHSPVLYVLLKVHIKASQGERYPLTTQQTFSDGDFTSFGSRVTYLGDIGGNGHLDFGFSTSLGSNRIPVHNVGSLAVVYGHNNGFRPAMNALPEFDITGKNREVHGIEPQQGFFFSSEGFGDAGSVYGIGDINHDGSHDLAFTAPYFPSAPRGGAIFVVFGKRGEKNFGAETYTDGMDEPPIDQLRTHNIVTDHSPDRGTKYFRIFGTDNTYEHAHLGYKVSWLGDFNGDKLNDFAFSAPGPIDNPGDSDLGRVFVYFGRNLEPQPDVWLSRNADPHSRINFGGNILEIRKEKAGTEFGTVFSDVSGDINGDTFSDILIGDPSDNRVYIVFGRPEERYSITGQRETIESIGHTLTIYGPQGSRFGEDVEFLGDVDADGLGDFAVSYGAGPRKGDVELIYGHIAYGRESADYTYRDLNGTDGQVELGPREIVRGTGDLAKTFDATSAHNSFYFGREGKNDHVELGSGSTAAYLDGGGGDGHDKLSLPIVNGYTLDLSEDSETSYNSSNITRFDTFEFRAHRQTVRLDLYSWAHQNKLQGGGRDFTLQKADGDSESASGFYFTKSSESIRWCRILIDRPENGWSFEVEDLGDIDGSDAMDGTGPDGYPLDVPEDNYLAYTGTWLEQEITFYTDPWISVEYE